MKTAAMSFLISFLAYAQQPLVRNESDSTKIYPIREVIISATRTEKPAAEVGRSVSVVTAEQAKNSMSNSIGELIGEQPGIYVAGGGQTMGMTQTVFTRGAASNHTAIMVDGVRVADPSTVNNAPDLSELSFLGIDRMEIVRGSHGTLFGSSAIGGVINFISQRLEKPGLRMNADVTSGVFGKKTFSLAENAMLRYSDPSGLYVNAGVSHQNVDGLDATVDTVRNPLVFKNRDRDGFTKTDLFGKIGYMDEKIELHCSYKFNTQKADIDASAFVDDNNYTLEFDRSLFTYGASYTLDHEWDLHYIGGFSEMNRRSVNDSSVIDILGNYDHSSVRSAYQGATMTNEFQSDFTFNGIDGIIGIGFYNETMNNRLDLFSWSSYGVYQINADLDSLDLHSTTKSVFLHANINGSLIDESLSDLSLGIGSRLNDHDAFGRNATIEINPSVKIFERGLLFSSYATGFNAPSLYQLYAPDRYYTSSITRGNRRLKPERSTSYEIGLRQSIGEKIDFSATYFNTTVENFIEFVYLWDKNIGLDTLGNSYLRDDYRGDTYLNLGKQHNYGFEFTINAHISERVFISANANIVSGKLSYQSSNINSGQTEGNHVQIYSNGAFLNKTVETRGLVRRPNTANILLRYLPADILALIVDVKLVGSRDDVYFESNLGPFGALGNVAVDRYTLVDFSQRLDLDEHFSLNGRIENIFDTKYYEIKGFTTRGRGVFLKLNCKF